MIDFTLARALYSMQLLNTFMYEFHRKPFVTSRSSWDWPRMLDFLSWYQGLLEGYEEAARWLLGGY